MSFHNTTIRNNNQSKIKSPFFFWPSQVYVENKHFYIISDQGVCGTEIVSDFFNTIASVAHFGIRAMYMILAKYYQLEHEDLCVSHVEKLHPGGETGWSTLTNMYMFLANKVANEPTSLLMGDGHRRLWTCAPLSTDWNKTWHVNVLVIKIKCYRDIDIWW